MTRERMNNEVITNEVANAVELNITKIEYGTQSWDIPTGWSIAEVVEAAQQLTVGISNPITANTGYDLVTDETTGTTKVVFHVPQTQNFGTKGTDDEVPAETPVEETGTVELNITKIEYGTQSWDIPAGWNIADVVEAAKQLTTGISNPITDNTGYDLVTDDVTGTTKVVFHVPQTQNFGTKGICA
jgi:RNase P/RNase MRP subunit p29